MTEKNVDWDVKLQCKQTKGSISLGFSPLLFTRIAVSYLERVPLYYLNISVSYGCVMYNILNTYICHQVQLAYDFDIYHL